MSVTPLLGRASRTKSVLSISSRKVRTPPSTNAATTMPGCEDEGCACRVFSCQTFANTALENPLPSLINSGVHQLSMPLVTLRSIPVVVFVCTAGIFFLRGGYEKTTLQFSCCAMTDRVPTFVPVATWSAPPPPQIAVPAAFPNRDDLTTPATSQAMIVRGEPYCSDRVHSNAR